MSNLTVYKTDGDYRLVRADADSVYQITYLEHKCSKEHEGFNEVWYGRLYSFKARGWACLWCKSRPTDGLQAMFWFLKEGS
jgi:hypothetical protein